MRWCILALVLLAPPTWADDAVALVGLDGGRVELRPAQGQLLILHFWATWCPSCLEDIRHLERAASACPSEGVRVVLVNAGEDDGVVRSFVDRHDLRLPVLRDPKGRVWRRSDGRGLPANLFWSDGGRKTDVGPKTAEEWRSLLAPRGCASAPVVE